MDQGGGGEAVCAWAEHALPLLRPLNLVHTRWTLAGCQFWAEASHEAIQVHLFAPYEPIENTSQLAPIDIAGLPGRSYVYPNTDDPTFCSIHVDLRTYAKLAIDAFDHEDYPSGSSDNRENCALATKVADALVHEYVPLAGGTPWPGTQQRPPDDVLRQLGPCEFIDSSRFSPIADDKPDKDRTDLGTTCTYRSEYGALRELITKGSGGLDDLPPQLSTRATRDTRLGVFPAREEQTLSGCAVSIETGSGQVHSARYTSRYHATDACLVARAVLANSIPPLIPLGR